MIHHFKDSGDSILSHPLDGSNKASHKISQHDAISDLILGEVGNLDCIIVAQSSHYYFIGRQTVRSDYVAELTLYCLKVEHTMPVGMLGGTHNSLLYSLCDDKYVKVYYTVAQSQAYFSAK